MPYPNIYEIGSRSGCWCDFPYVITQPGSPLNWNWREEGTPNPAATSQVRALAELIASNLGDEPFELWPVQDLTEDEPPWGVIDIDRSAFVPETFYFDERFVYRVAGVAR